ncbi:MAG: chemotaxis protein CheA [Geobacteraceae bacterium]|nr:chemotaxis protein CheA [Geobacteraceae bacterium]
MIDDHFATFIEEARELLAELESGLVELEEHPDDGELVGRIFRALHTLKGSAGMFGLETLAGFVHRFESVFEMVRNDELSVSRELVDLGLKAADLFGQLIETPEGGVKLPSEILDALDALAAQKVSDAAISYDPSAEAYADISSYANLLTEYELSRVKAASKKGRKLYLIRLNLRLDALSQELAAFAKKISKSGELISTIPLTDPAPDGCLGFNMLFASSHTPEKLGKELEHTPLQVNHQSLFKPQIQAYSQSNSKHQSIYRIRFSPKPESLVSGLNPLAVIEDLQRLGECVIVPQTKRIPELESLDPKECYVFWDIILLSESDPDEIRDVFIFVEEGSEVRIERIDDGSGSQEDNYKRLGEILVERGDITSEELSGYLDNQKQLGRLLVEADAVSSRAVESALIEQSFMKDVLSGRQKNDVAQSIRVPAEKLDFLVNLAGEMVTLQARLSQCSLRYADPDLISIAEEVERLTAELRDTTLNIRMLPIGTTFSRFKRVVRDLGEELGKRVQLTTSGGETEIDKTVIEKLNDPLVHLIRNSIDHGIESADERRRANKPVEGNIHLAAVHEGDSVVITISDDGKGLDYDAIRSKATELGLSPVVSELSDREVSSFIFMPGFSTAGKVSGISGRGVGMDVVKRSIDSLRGSIELLSQPGEGTKVVIRLPLTLVIIESLLVKVGNDRFVLPLSLVEECVELDKSQNRAGHGDLIDVRGQLVPFIYLRERFTIGAAPPELQQIVIMNHENQRIGIAVDHVIGQHQAVIKPLGRFYEGVEELSGATILGDGTVALIVDVPKIVRKAALTK